MSPHPYEQELQSIRDDNRWRALRQWSSSGGIIEHGGRRYLNFSSNDYLDLAGHRVLKEAVGRALETYGCSATASRLMSGDLAIHHELEASIANLTDQEAAVVFPSGYQANVGVLSALAGRGDTIFSDALNHASIIDGARLSRAAIQVYRHGDSAHLAELLESAPAEGRKIIVTDSVFSMDGDVAPLDEIGELADEHEAVLIVDEAHALGVMGSGGGVCIECGTRPALITGTFGKAFGAGGAFAAGDKSYCDLLINKARSFIYSTGLTPMNAAAANAAIALVEQDFMLGEKLLDRSAGFQEMLEKRGVPIVSSETQIIPVLVGDNQRVMAYADALLEQGLIVTGIRPPTVPEGTARLRFSVTLAHSRQDLKHAAEVIARVMAG